MSQAPRLKVLIIAEAANPEWVSVPLIGWSLARALGAVCDAHVVTQIRNKAAIERTGWRDGVEFTAIDSEAVARPAYKMAELLRMGQDRGWTIVQAFSSLAYPYFEHLVWKRFGAQIRAGEYDIVHRVTPLTPSANSLLARRCKKAGVPFVVGPLNGGVPWPKGYEHRQKAEGDRFSALRGVIKLLPGRGRFLKSCAAVIAGSKITKADLPTTIQERTVIIPENAVDLDRFTKQIQAPFEGCLRILFIGRLVPCKAVDTLIKAAAPLLSQGRATLSIIGDGPERAGLEALANALGVAHAITFHGWVPHREIQDIAVHHHVMGFPSIREFGGGVVLEAMAMGLVPIVADYAGPAELVDPAVGYRVDMTTEDRLITGLRDLLTQITDNITALAPKSTAARTTIEERFTWPRKADQIVSVYHWVLGHGPQPHLFEHS